MKGFRFAIAIACIAASTAILSSCVKKNFDAPADQSNYDPMLPVTTTIAQLKAMNGAYLSGDDTTLITGDIVISGIVTANDQSGNLYKQIVIQDSTGAIMLLANAYSLYGNYPVGRKVYVKCQGLYLGYDGGIPELGTTPDERASLQGILGTDISKNIVKADLGHAVIDTVVTLAAVKNYNAALVNRLVTITDVEFEDTVSTYTSPTATTNRYVEDCSGNSLVVRTSNYANFHATVLPHGKGSITGIYTVYQTKTGNTLKSTPQLVIRDTNDVKFNDGRCGSGGPGPVGNGSIVTLDSLRKLYTGTDVSLTGYKIAGIVISDAGNKNVSTGNVILQNGNKGIELYYGSTTPAYVLGDSLVIDLTGMTLTSYQGALEIKTASTAKTTKISGGNNVTPTVVTTAQLNAGIGNYENTLIKINNATISGGTFSGSKTLTDATGTVTLYTASAATFSTQTVPTGTVSVTGIATPYTTGPEVKMRNASDVQ